MTQTPPAVTVVVLSYNGTADTLACLDSLLDDDRRQFSILVVDNGSTDGAPAAIRARFPDICLIELPENLGWAGGNNVAIEHALRQGAGFICLLNNDTIVPRGAIARLAETARRFGACLLHPAIDFADRSEGAQIDPRKTGGPGVRPLPEDADVYEVGYAYGACLMIPADVFHRVGRFDERFFLQMEETDFWLRARKLGVRSLCDTGTRIVHAESRGFGARMTPMKTYYIVRNTLLLTEKHNRAPAGMARALLSLWRLAVQLAGQEGRGGSTASVILWSLSRATHMRAARAAVRDYVMRRFGRISVAARRAIGGS
jgi:GT2 family glycosyltransferase